MTDNLKAEADVAWFEYNDCRSPLGIRAAVEASIAAALAEHESSVSCQLDGIEEKFSRSLAQALAPVLERVARLEADNSHDAPDPDWERRWDDPKPTVPAATQGIPQSGADGPAVTPTPCAICNGARWVCDVSVDGASYHRSPCPACSKPAASPEGEIACTRHGQAQCPACAAERRIAELEGANAARQAAAFANGRAEGRAESAARIAELEHALSQSNLVGLAALANARVEGREAGIREAAEDIKQHGWTVAHNRVLALLAPCAICNGARWVCDVSVDGASSRRKPCPACSKPAASPEGTLQHNPGLGSVTMSTEQAAALLQPPSPAESKGNGQWRVGRKLGRTLYVGDKCIGMVDTPELAAAIVEAMNAYPAR